MTEIREMEQPGQGLAVTGFILGLLSLLAALPIVIWFVALPLGVIGLVFSAGGFAHGLGKAGLILSILGIVGSLVGLAVFVAVINA